MNRVTSNDDEPEDLIPTRKSLLGRLQDWQDNESWRAFFDTYWKLIYNFALQRGLLHAEAEEVVQETFLAVAKNIARFQYNPNVCSFKSWLLTVTRSKIANQFEKRARRPAAASPEHEDPTQTPLLERLPDEAAQAQWEHAWEEEWQKNLMEAAIRWVKARVSTEYFQMFDLFVIKGWPAREVAKTLGVTIAHVYVAKHRLTRLIRKEIETLERKGT
jgi:RNA polymerase sigma factor (sigma-70 family)